MGNTNPSSVLSPPGDEGGGAGFGLGGDGVGAGLGAGVGVGVGFGAGLSLVGLTCGGLRVSRVVRSLRSVVLVLGLRLLSRRSCSDLRLSIDRVSVGIGTRTGTLTSLVISTIFGAGPLKSISGLRFSSCTAEPPMRSIAKMTQGITHRSLSNSSGITTANRTRKPRKKT